MDLVQRLGFTISVTLAQATEPMNKFASAGPDSGALAKIWPSSLFFNRFAHGNRRLAHCTHPGVTCPPFFRCEAPRSHSSPFSRASASHRPRTSGACHAVETDSWLKAIDTGMLRDMLRTQMGTLSPLFSMRANDPSFIRLTVLTGMVASFALMSANVVLCWRYRAGQSAPNSRPACPVWILVQWARRSERL